MQLKLVSENTVYRKNLLAEHGLSIWFEYNGKNYLFDTGQGQVLAHNARHLDIKFRQLDGIFITHDHYDHTGGLNEILSVNKDVPVYSHPDILENQPAIKNDHGIKKATQISEGLWMTGEIAPDKDWSNIKYSKEAATENSLFIKTKQGLVVLVGCSHPGIIRILKKIKDIAEGEKIKAVIGGMHLLNKDKEELNEIVYQLKSINVDLISPLHCSGFAAAKVMSDNFGDRQLLPAVGDTLTL